MIKWQFFSFQFYYIDHPDHLSSFNCPKPSQHPSVWQAVRLLAHPKRAYTADPKQQLINKAATHDSAQTCSSVDCDSLQDLYKTNNKIAYR